jgi:hypothetical protein
MGFRFFHFSEILINGGAIALQKVEKHVDIYSTSAVLKPMHGEGSI